MRLAMRVPVNCDIPECVDLGSALRVKLDQSKDDARDLDHIDDVERDLLCLGLGWEYAEEIYREREATEHRRKEVKDRKDVLVKEGMHEMVVVQSVDVSTESKVHSHRGEAGRKSFADLRTC